MMQKANRSLGKGALQLSPHLKDTFEKFEQYFQAANLPQGKYIKTPASTSKWYKLGQPSFEDKLQELKQILQKSVSPLNPLGRLWVRSPYKSSKILSIRQGKTSASLIFRLLSLRLHLSAI